MVSSVSRWRAVKPYAPLAAEPFIVTARRADRQPADRAQLEEDESSNVDAERVHASSKVRESILAVLFPLTLLARACS